ncbi:unnamed protein product [Pelagomonas calceolata]|uniref:Conserved oligomeric Golgi complex subunit 4 N-terminal domain-containing protein n=3 Tax=Pelagomonas calceolata TaxID=35677 RepID=A0A8J2WTZ7_9STRA|nr:unnamed protein product [Pelagomonas calceolata]
MAATTAEKIAFHAANVARTAPRLEALCGRSEDAARRAGALAERIRRADDRRARLAQAIQAATDVLSLRDCAAGVDAAVATDDLETAAAHVAKFRLIEGAARAGGPALEGELEAMRRCTARVEGVVRDRFREACVARDGDAVRRWLPLLKELNLADEAATEAFLDHFREDLRQAVSKVLQDAESPPLVTLRTAINAVAGVVSSTLAQAHGALEAHRGGPRALLLAHDACETASLTCVARFAADSRIASCAAEALRDDRWPTEGPAAMALDALDGLLEDAATALRHLETWRRFAAHQARSVLREDVFGAETRLNAAAAELGEWYAVLECRLCLAALRAAETLDTSADVVASLVRDDVDVFGDAAAAATVAHGSSADDAFWAARRSAARALSSGHAAAADNVVAFVCDRLARETLHGLATRCFDGLAGAGALIKAHEGFGGALAGGTADETLKAVGAGLQQHGEALAAGTAQVLANISEATGLELEEGVVDPGLARRAAAERDRTLRTKLVEAQVALNGLDAACEAHLGRLRLHLEDEVGASYGSDRGDPAVAKLLEAVAALGRRGSAGEAFGDALEKARAALASTALAQPIARSIAGRGDVGARARFALGDTDAVAPHRWACAEALYEALGRVDDFGAAARRAADACAPRATAHLAPRNLVDAARRTAAAAGDALLEELRDRARVKKATPLGALQLDRDVRALRAALAAGLGGGVEVAAAVREGLGLAQHVATLLGLDDRGEASDVVSRYVAPDELPEVLALRRWPGEPEEVAPPPPPPEEDAELALMMP